MLTPPDQFDEENVSAAHEAELEQEQVVPSAVEPDPVRRNVEDLTLAEVFGQLLRAPGLTWNALQQVLTARRDFSTPTLAISPRTSTAQLPGWIGKLRSQPTEADVVFDPAAEAANRLEAFQLGLRFFALLIGIAGNNILANNRYESIGLDVGAPYLIGAFLLWLISEIVGAWPALRAWRPRLFRQSVDETDEPILAVDAIVESTDNPFWVRLSLVAAALTFSFLTALLNSGNRFTIPGVLVWFISIGAWVAAFAPLGWGMRPAWNAIRRVRIRRDWVFWTLMLILLLGAIFRLTDLTGTPQEMTSDHVEKLLDAQRVVDGTTQVFFPNNGGRDPMQFYILALFHEIAGLPMTFTTLKLVTVIEGMVSILLLWWMGREIIGAEDRRLGNLVGLLLAALVAASYWHTALSRLGLRIILTVSFTALLIVYLSRAMRYNRRGDFIKAGLVLGFGLYAYQAVRMLPVVIVAGVGIALLFNARGLRARGRYLAHLFVLVIIALAVFVPLLTFSLQYPNDFWRRTSGRLLGDELIQTTDENGNLIERRTTIEERLVAFQQNIPILANNIRNALLMYNWKGDVAWINAAPNRPAMDVFTGTLLIVGIAAWLARMVRRRDVAEWLLPLMVIIMILPSALSIAYPVENPSATRMSGTLPEVYLFAALPLALLVGSLVRLMPGHNARNAAIGAAAIVAFTQVENALLLAIVVGLGVALMIYLFKLRSGVVLATVLCAALVWGAYDANQRIYFGEYKIYYTGSSLPYTEAGRALRGFADSGGDLGNAFMIAYLYWWDHRAMGIEAGVMDWPNGIVQREDVPRFLLEASQRGDRYQLNPDKDLLFFYNLADDETEAQLKTWFPNGYAEVFESYQPEDTFKIFRVPALGAQGMLEFMAQSGIR